MQLSAHLSLAEVLATTHTEFSEQQSAPPPEVLWNLQRHAFDLWEPMRALWGPTKVNSGYRCLALNTLVGGRPNSYHCLGLATDNSPDMALKAAMLAAIASPLPFDELIWERGTWIHLQSPKKGNPPRRLALMTFDAVHYTEFNPNDSRVK